MPSNLCPMAGKIDLHLRLVFADGQAVDRGQEWESEEAP